jgi:hypothetical protein
LKDIIIKKRNIIYWLFLFFCFFPFLNLLRLPTDSQPNALILASIIILMNHKLIIEHFPGKLLIFLFLALISIFPIIYSKLGFDTIISLISYLSLIIVPLAVLISLIKLGGLSYQFFLIVVLTWFLVAVVQRFLYPDFLSFLLTRNVGNGFMGRGVNSLAPEPTYYGSIIVLLAITYYINFPNHPNKLLVISSLLIQLFILSISSTIFAVLFFSFFVYTMIKFFKFQIGFKPLITFLLILLIFFIVYQVFYETISETRIYKIINIVISNPDIILLDESINERVNHAFFPLVSIFENYGLPMGYGNFQDYIIQKTSDPKYQLFFEKINFVHYKKIMSGYGAVFFELGIFGIIIPIYLYKIFKKNLNKSIFLFIFIALNFLLFTSISLNNPLILFVFGNILYLNYLDVNNNL